MFLFSLPMRLRTQRIFIFVISCLVIGELLAPCITLHSWPRMDTSSKESETRLLLAADPHVEGYHPTWYWFNYLCQWDSDRYLRNVFQFALKRLNPTGLLILGDLFDRGSEADWDEFNQTCARFRDIFQSDQHSLPYLLLPGDNDVDVVEGGPTDPISVARFVACFGQPPAFVQIQFVRLQTLARGEYKLGQLKKYKSDNSAGQLLVFATHEPVMFLNDDKLNAALNGYYPCLFISGHHHKAYLFHRRPTAEHRFMYDWQLEPDEPHPRQMEFHLNLSSCFTSAITKPQTSVGLGVPSCTYRSGYVMETAFGLLQIYRDGTAIYRILPLPPRTYTLYLYLFCLIVCLLHAAVCVLRFSWRRFRNNRRQVPFKLVA